MKKKKIIRLILVLALVAAVAAGTYFIIEAFKEPETVDPNVRLINKTKSDITRMSFTKDGETFTLKWERDSEGNQTAKFSDTPAEVEQNRAESARSIFSSLNANRLIEENASDLSKYGLDKPQVTIKGMFSGADSEPITLNIGAMTPAKNAYYVTAEGGEVPKENVYTILSVHAGELIKTKDDFRLMPSLAVDEGTISMIEFKSRTGSEMLMTALSESYGIANWMLLSPYIHELSTDSLDPFVGQILATVPTKFITENATDEELAEYGLRTNNEYVRVVGGENAEQKGMLEFGNELPDGSGMRYMAVNNGRTVYAIEESSISWMNTPAITLLEKRIVSTNIKYMDKMVITEGTGRTLEITVERTEKKDSEGNTVKDDEGNIEYNEKFYLNGELKDEKQARTLYAKYVGLMVHGDYDPEKGYDENDLVMSVEFHFSQGLVKQRTISFYGYDIDHYAVIMDGEPAFYIRKGSVDAALAANQQFIDGALQG